MTAEVEVFVDGLDAHPVKVGTLRPSFMGGRTLAGASFQYEPAYLAHQGRYEISPDLPLVSGRTFTPADRRLFGAFSDAAPDEWGQKIIQANHARSLGATDPSAAARLGAFDFLLGVSDATRMGALRFRRPGEVEWLANDTGVENVHELSRIVSAAGRYESDEATDDDVAYLADIATSPGGARPKANVILSDGSLGIAKLPHSKDGSIDVESWEALAFRLASGAGIRVPRTERHQATPTRSVLVSRRFDRLPGGSRVGYVSAATAMQLSDLDSGSATYADFAETIAELSHQPAADLREMFARVALTVLINNVDDHWRNHGFLRGPKGWSLAPAFDLNPSRMRGVLSSRRISDVDDPRDRDLRNLTATARVYGVAHAEAASILRRVAESVARWRSVAEELAIPRPQVEAMAVAFDQQQLTSALDA